MGGLREFSIPFRGLKEGKHVFSFEIGNTFFDQFESSEIKKGRINAGIVLDKKSQFMEVDIHLEGMAEVICDRCLDAFELEISQEATLYVRFGDISYEESDKVIVLGESENEFQTAQYLYEYIHLALPYKRIHPEINGVSGCNLEMVQKLNQHIAGKIEEEKNDPRWDQLKGLIDNI